MMEIVDFLCDLRQAIGSGERILLVALQMPLAEGTSGIDANLAFEQWQHKLTTIGDPWLKVRPLTLSAQLLQSGMAEQLKPDTQEATDV